MKNVLILSSSPRKNGNSDALCDEFLKGAQESGNVCEKIFLRDKKIGYCTDCGYCKEHGGKCSQNDDMAEVLDKMVKADVIVLSTPVYFYTMSAQMKTLIDRTVARYLEISSKEFYFIITAADTDETSLELTLDSLRGFTDMCLNNPVEKGVIIGSGVWKKGEITGTRAMKKAYETGKNV